MQDNFTDFQAIFPTLSTDLSYNCTTSKVEKNRGKLFTDIQYLKFYRFIVCTYFKRVGMIIGRNGRTFTRMNEPFWLAIQAWMHLESGVIIEKTDDFWLVVSAVWEMTPVKVWLGISRKISNEFTLCDGYMYWLLSGLIFCYSSVQHLKKQAWKKFGEEHPVSWEYWFEFLVAKAEGKVDGKRERGRSRGQWERDIRNVFDMFPMKFGRLAIIGDKQFEYLVKRSVFAGSCDNEKTWKRAGNGLENRVHFPNLESNKTWRAWYKITNISGLGE